MTRQSLRIGEDLSRYLSSLHPAEPELLQRLREETARLPFANMQIGRDQGRFMTLLLQSIGATKTIEVGVFTGYSTLVTALAIPESGRVVACDINTEWTDVAQRYWREAGVAQKIDLRIRPARDTLDELVDAGESGAFDFAFIDADKTGYDDYYERCLTLVRPGGLIAIDNALWGGSVVDAEDTSDDTLAIRALNEKMARDERIASYLAPLGDGIHLGVKK
ncbi:MAG: class I SAM-dependent methyltransferase [Pseudomonadota bacterium]